MAWASTFFLDVAWWALTGTWARNPAWPDPACQEVAEIGYDVNGHTAHPTNLPSHYIPSLQEWPWSPPGEMSDIVVYALVDEGFSVWDPARNYWKLKSREIAHPPDWPEVYHFNQRTLWNGLDERYRYEMSWDRGPRELVGESKIYSNGLIRDWVTWQFSPDRSETARFHVLTKVLEKLSPDPESEVIRPSEPIRLTVGDARKIPTIRLPYGTVPVVYASAGMKRILSLAYLLVWTWYEHQEACRILRRKPSQGLILLVDELEAHLHPKWQRSILPALLEVARLLGDDIATQVIATTHSPLILASVESLFNESSDSVFVFDEEAGKVSLSKFEWAKYGDMSDWLTSPIFGLGRARSKDAERAMEAAYAYMRGEPVDGYGELSTKEAIHRELLKVLPDDDPFMIGWDFHMRKEQQDQKHYDSL